ncbi:unnamed protein product [Closterium sp. NIES-54]
MRATCSIVRASFRRSQDFSTVQLALVALLAVAFTAHNAAASIVYRSAGVHATSGVPMRNLGRWRAQEGAMTAGGRALISSNCISISGSSSGGIGSGGEGGEIPEWARSEGLRFETARARHLGQAEEDEAERVKRAEKAEMARALWEETEAQFEGRLQEWRRQSARLQGMAQRKREKRARRARRKWARAQRKAKRAHARAERSSSGVYTVSSIGGSGDGSNGGYGSSAVRAASPTDEELLDLMPGGTRSLQNLKASTTRSSSASPSAFSASIASSSTSSSSSSASNSSSSSSGLDGKNITANPTPWEENRPAGESPCSPRSTAPVINVTTLDHILSCTQYPPTQTVTLVLQTSITLNHSLLLDSNFSCTIFQADTLPSENVLEITTDTEPVLQPVIQVRCEIFWNSFMLIDSNFSCTIFLSDSLPSEHALEITTDIEPVLQASVVGLIAGARLALSILTRPISSACCCCCPLPRPCLACRSYGIQFTQASVVGRIDVFRCAYTKLDSLFATAPWDFQYHPGVIRMGMSGIGVNLTSSENIVSNNDLFGAWELIYLYRETIGATVRNNFLHDYLFSGFRCSD